jgi:hypothetical protein
MWPFRKRQKQDLQARAYTWSPNRGQVLDSLPDDDARYDQCLAWAEEERNKFYQGLHETVQDVVTSTSDRYRPYSPETRKHIGQLRWGSSSKSKELAGAEQMYMRWATGYKNSPRQGLGRRSA